MPEADPRSLAATHPTRTQHAGSLLVFGMLVFIAASFAPVPVDYTTSVAAQYAAIPEDPTMWLIVNGAYIVGVGLTWAGLYVLRGLLEQTRGRQLAIVAVAVNGLAGLVFAVAAYYSVTLPGSTPTVPPLFEAAMGGWLYATYLLLTLGSFVLLGTALLIGSPMRRIAWIAVGLSTILLGAFVVLGDLPPLLGYLVTGPIGGWLVYRARSDSKVEKTGRRETLS